jgi:hypothetical protein
MGSGVLDIRRDHIQLLTNKQSLNHTRIARSPLPALAPGEALLKIVRVALTTNNITYAAFGDAMQ